MSTLAPLIAAWDEAYRELGIALGGLSDEDLWRRADPRLLSVGELAGHVGYAQAAWTFGGGNYAPDITKLPITSPLIDARFRYYPSTVETEVRLDIGTSAVHDELLRIHKEAKAAIDGKKFEDPYPGMWKIWGNMVQYQVFHVAYHTGQAYSVRHLLGHQLEDN